MTVLVIGAGMSGCVTALELARASVDVVLLETNEKIMDGASRYNEGKIHLGYVYAKDTNGRTIDLMQKGSNTFASILSRHISKNVFSEIVSLPFDYVIHPQSQLNLNELANVYQTIEKNMQQLGLNSCNTDYLYQPFKQKAHWRSASEIAKMRLSSQGKMAVYATQERALDPSVLADAIVKSVFASQIDVICNRRVISISKKNGFYWVLTSGGQMGPFESVVNASWASQAELDRSVGLVIKGDWNYRFKYFLRVQKPGIGLELQNITWAVGPFGDVVSYGNDYAYLSWYSAGCVNWSLNKPITDVPIIPDRVNTMYIKKNILAGLKQLLPSIGLINPTKDNIEVRGGIIVGNGKTDIYDPYSGLHQRDNIGVVTHGGYHSISSGKLTTAPMVGFQAASAVLSGVV